MSYRESHRGAGRGDLYDSRYSMGAEAFHWLHIERPFLLRLFDDVAQTSRGPLLDFACGTGRILEVAETRFSKTWGIDVSDDMLAVARQKCPKSRILRADVTDGTVQLESFAVITAFRFLLNAEPPLRLAVLRWMRRTLAPDGILIVNNHLSASSLQGLRHRYHAWRGRPPVTVLGDHEVRSLLGHAGFAVNRTYGLGLIPPRTDEVFLPERVLLAAEHILRLPGLQRLAYNQIYVCRPR